MPRDQAPATKEVADSIAASSQHVEESLRGIVSAAQEADAAHGRLSDTQREALKITRSFSKAVDAYSKKLVGASRATSGFATVNRVIAGTSGMMGDLAANTNAAAVSLGKASSGGTAFSSELKAVKSAGDDAISTIKELSKEVQGLAAQKVQIGFAVDKLPDIPAIPPVSVDVKWNVTEVPVAKAAADITAKAAVKAVKTTKAGAKAAAGVTTKAATKAAKATKAGGAKSAVAARAKASAAIMSGASGTLTEEIDRVAGFVDLLKKSMQEGREEAERFAGGLGKLSGGAVAAGVAMVYLLDKASELIEGYLDAAKSLATFNVQTKVLAATTIGVDYGQLSDLRDELNLTRDQAASFYQVVKEGSESGVVSVSELAAASVKLRDAFGGDPTEKLKDFVELVRTIPTLEADLSVTASMDDKAASLFALAKAGKITTLIEMQSAGLLGGVDVSIARPEDVKMLNEQQKATKTQEDIKDFLVGSLMPSVGPHVPVIAKMVTGIFGFLGGTLAVTGAMGLFLQRRQIRATKDVEDAVHSLSGRRGGKRALEQTGLTVLKKIWQGRGRIVDATKGGGVKGGLQAALRLGGLDKYAAILKKKGFGVMVKSVPRVNTFMVKNAKLLGLVNKAWAPLVPLAGKLGGIFLSAARLANPLGIVAALLGVAGMAAKGLSEKLKESGHDLTAAFADTQSEALSAAGTIAGFAAAGAIAGAALGAIGGPLSAVTAAGGAVAGGLLGLAKVLITSTDDIGASQERFGQSLQIGSGLLDREGNEIKKYGTVLQRVGKGHEIVGGIIKQIGPVIRSGFSSAAKWAWETAKAHSDLLLALVPFGAQIYNGVRAVTAFAGWLWDSVIYTKEYAAALKESHAVVGRVNKAYNEAIKPNKAYKDAVTTLTKRLQESSLALQSELKALEAISGGVKYQFADLQKEVAGIDLKLLGEFGGTTARYEKVIGDKMNAVTNKFEGMGKELVKERARIIGNSKLNAEQRKQALTQLSKIELEAAREFQEGMHEIILAMLETPEIIRAGLKESISRIRSEMAQGTVTADEAQKIGQKRINDAVDGFRQVLEAMDKMSRMQAERDASLKEMAETEKKAAVDAYSSLSQETKRKAGLGRAGVLDVKIEDMKAPQLEKALKESEAQMKYLGDRIEAERKKMPQGDLGGFAERGARIKSEEMRIAEERKKAEKELKKAPSATKTAIEDRIKKLKEDEKEKTEEKAKLSRDIETWAESLTDSQGKQVPVSKKQIEIIKKLVESGKAAGDAAVVGTKEWEDVGSLLRSLPDSQGRAIAAMQKQAMLLAAQEDISMVVETLRMRLVAVAGTDTVALEELKVFAEKAVEWSQKLTGAIDDRVKNMTAEEHKANVELQKLQDLAEVDAMMGRGMDNMAKQTQTTIDASKAVEENVSKIAQDLSNLQEVLKVLEAKMATNPSKELSTQILSINNSMKTVEEKSTEAAKRLAVAQENILKEIGRFDDAMDKAAKTFMGRKFKAEIDLSETEKALAEFSPNTEEVARRAMNRAATAYAEIFKMEEKSLDDRLRQEREALVKAADIRKKFLMSKVGGGLGAAEAAAQAEAEKAEQERAMLAEHERASEESRLKLVKGQLDAVTEMARIQTEMLDVELERVGVAQDLAEVFSGSAEDVSAQMKLGVELEKKRLEVVKWEAAESRRMYGDSHKTRQLDLQVVKQEAEIRKKELDVVKKVNELRLQEIATREEGLEAELDYLSYIGAHYSRMLDIQGDIVALAREKYDEEVRTLEAFKKQGVGGQRLLEQETKVRKAWFDMQKKGMGVQKDMMDKILGSAFGQLRDIGPMTGVNRVSAKRGIAGSRVYNAAGMPMAAGPEGVRPIAERAILRQLKGIGGAAPRRLSGEEQLAKAMSGTEDATTITAGNTKDTAIAVGNMDKGSRTSGSLFTHDQGAHSILESILSVTRELAISVINSLESGNNAAERIDKAIKDSAVKADAAAAKNANLLGSMSVDAASVAKGTKENAQAASGLQDSFRRSVMESALAGFDPTRENLDILAGKETAVKDSAAALEKLAGAADDAAKKTKGVSKTMGDTGRRMARGPRGGRGKAGGGGASPGLSGLSMEQWDAWQKAGGERAVERAKEDALKTIGNMIIGEEGSLYAKGERIDYSWADELDRARRGGGADTTAKAASPIPAPSRAMATGRESSEAKRKGFLARNKNRLGGKFGLTSLGGTGYVSRPASEGGSLGGTGYVSRPASEGGSLGGTGYVSRPASEGAGIRRPISGGGAGRGTGAPASAYEPAGGHLEWNRMMADKGGRMSNLQGQASRQAIPGNAERDFAARPSMAFAAPAGEGAMAGGATAMKITGELRIISNDPMIDGKFGQLVARAMATPEVQAAIRQNGLLQVKS